MKLFVATILRFSVIHCFLYFFKEQLWSIIASLHFFIKNTYYKESRNINNIPLIFCGYSFHVCRKNQQLETKKGHRKCFPANFANFFRAATEDNICKRWIASNLIVSGLSIRTFFTHFSPAGIYLFKDNNRNTRTMCEICFFKLTIITLEQHYWRRFGVFLLTLKQVFLLLTLNK